MDLSIRRVVTGHNEAHKSVVTSDEVLPVSVRRPGQQGCVVWVTDHIPADNSEASDTNDSTKITPAQGAVFRVIRYEPGSVGRMHRTETLDYGVVLSGSIVLDLDEGNEVTLRPGDVLVQRGTVHNWINRSDEPCTIAFVLVDALPLPAEG